jgi:hypothetical protein
LDASGLQQENAGDDLQAIGDAMLHLLQQQLLLTHKLRQFPLHRAPLADVLDGQQQGRVRFALGENRPRIEQHGAPADVGELVLDLVAVHDKLLRQDFFQQHPQRGDVPLAVAQRVQQPALRILRVGAEGVVERAAGGDDAQVLIQDKEWLAHGVDDGLS